MVLVMECTALPVFIENFLVVNGNLSPWSKTVVEKDRVWNGIEAVPVDLAVKFGHETLVVIVGSVPSLCFFLFRVDVSSVFKGYRSELFFLAKLRRAETFAAKLRYSVILQVCLYNNHNTLSCWAT